jgi:drug/metabolite transporter (DMT)-like permease
MSPLNFLLLLVLAALWGASFLFMRVAVPVLGPVWLIEWRVLLGALTLALLMRLMRQALDWRLQWRRYLFMGLLNTALPFVLYAWAAQWLTASLLSVINATAPIWGVVIARLWPGPDGPVPITGHRLLGLTLGVGGVALLVGLDPALLHPGSGWAALGAVLAPLCYAIATQFTIRFARGPNPPSTRASAEGSMWGASLCLLPLLLFVPFTPVAALNAPDATQIVASVLMLGLLCTGLAYLIYFHLIAALGAASALTVTFLIPVFGILWGHAFLGEAVGWHTLACGLMVLTGTALVTGFDPRSLLSRGAKAA